MASSDSMVSRTSQRVSPGRRVLAGILLGTLGLAFILLATLGPTPEPVSAESSLARLNRSLRQQLELSQGKDFYLILDLRSPQLRLMLEGVVLREFPVVRVDMGTPIWMYRRRAAHTPGPDRIWSGGRLQPPRDRDRFELVVARQGQDQTPEIPLPPTVEEAIPVPAEYRVCFQQGLALVIRHDDASGVSHAASLWHGLGERLWDSVSLLVHPRSRTPRLRLLLDDDAAAALYRCLPPNPKFLLVG